jgi:hypothetical protein
MKDCDCKVLSDCNTRMGCKNFAYAASLADSVENRRVTCKHEPSGFDLEQQGYDVIIKALRAYAQIGGY